MEDANTYYLHEHFSEEDELDKRQAMIEERAKDLLEGEYNPFLPNNVTEALAQIDWSDACLLGAYVGTAAKLKDNVSAQIHLADFVVNVCKEYWEDAARKRAKDEI